MKNKRISMKFGVKYLGLVLIPLCIFFRGYSQSCIYGKIKRIDSSSFMGYYIISIYDKKNKNNYKVFSKRDTITNGDRLKVGKKYRIVIEEIDKRTLFNDSINIRGEYELAINDKVILKANEKAYHIKRLKGLVLIR